MNSELTNYSDNSSTNKRLNQALDNFFNKLEADLVRLNCITQHPSGQGEVDAFLALAPKSEDPSYQASYEQTSAALLFASIEEQQLMALMQPEVKRLLEEKAV